jgi:hypothetical protein
MIRAFVLAALLVPSVALAQTSSQVGAWADASGGVALGGGALRADPTARLALGAWWGNYDDALALGRSWGLGAAVRLDARRGEPRVAPMVELRRQIDLLILGLRWRALAGAEWHGDALGVGARVGGSLMIRVRPQIGPFIDLEAGGGYVGGAFRPAMAAGVGVASALRLTDARRRGERRDARERGDPNPDGVAP